MPRIVIRLEGGLVENVISDEPDVECLIVNEDDGDDFPESYKPLSLGGGEAPLTVFTRRADVEESHSEVQELFDAIEVAEVETDEE